MRRQACWIGLLAPLLCLGVAGDASVGAPIPATACDLRVETDGALLTVKACAASLEELLAEVARQAGFRVLGENPIDRRLTLDFERLPLSEALGRILPGHGLVFVYPPPPARTSGPADLWVCPPDREEARPAGRTGDGRFREEVSAETADPVARLGLALADDDPRVRRSAAAGLAEVDDEAAVRVLANAALHDREPEVREEAILGIGEIGGDDRLAILEQALLDPDRRVRRAAIDAVAGIGGEDSARFLAPALDDPDPALREDAVNALGEIGGAGALVLLQHALGDEHAVVREAAAQVLAELSRRGP